MKRKFILALILSCLINSSITAFATQTTYNDGTFSLSYNSDLFTVKTSETGTISVSAINMPSANGGHNTVLGSLTQANADYDILKAMSEQELQDFKKTFVYEVCTGLFEIDNGITVVADGYTFVDDSCEYFMILSDGTECYVTMHNYGETVYYTVCRLCPYSATLSDEFRSIYRSVKLTDNISNPETNTNNSYEVEYIAMSEKFATLQSEYDALLTEKEIIQGNYDALLTEYEATFMLSPETDLSFEQPPNTEELLQKKLTGIEKNTNAALNKVIEIAKNDAISASETQLNNAIAAIRDNYPQYYNGPECMELYLYYGYLLDYAFDDSDPRSELGVDTYQAIKYVYRNIETILDPSTKANLDQIEKDLQYIG